MNGYEAHEAAEKVTKKAARFVRFVLSRTPGGFAEMFAECITKLEQKQRYSSIHPSIYPSIYPSITWYLEKRFFNQSLSKRDGPLAKFQAVESPKVCGSDVGTVRGSN